MNLLLKIVLVLPIFALFVYNIGISWFLTLTLPLIIVWYRRNVYVIIRTLPRDLRFIYRMSQLVSRTRKYERANMNVVSAFRKQLTKTPNKPIYLFGDSVWTMMDVEIYSNKIANLFHKSGFRKSDVIGLMMSNRPEFICIWLGLAKLGVITALINTNLKGQCLLHCVKCASCKGIIFSEDMAEVVLELNTDLPLFQADGYNNENSVKNILSLFEELSPEPPEIKDIILYTDKLLYIYTSGTTGLPKPAILPHSRYIMATMATMSLLGVTSDDVIYNPLPLYHTAGGALGAGPALLQGITTVLRMKFSASSYIPDCIRYKCTIGQYIGEMCRYILAVPPSNDDTVHSLRFMIGNGLRPAIWSAFVRRFQIPQITEVYGATEGNVNIANLDNTIGAVGSLPKCLPQCLFPLAIIKIDPETEEPIRRKDGLCIRCKADEPGMFVGLIKNNDPSRQFHGYVSQAESKKKIIYNVFTKGDSAFVSGDVMVMDEFGYIYFKDRTGDTFRWKGENIATSEVEAVVSTVTGLKDCTVYGVKVGDLEGKAGMAAVVDPQNELDMPAFAYAIDKALPNYARPLFLRILRTMELTGTFKMKKMHLQKQGFDPEEITDKLYFRQGSTYVPLTKHLYLSIIAGNTKL